ncbi:MAG: hypothetical protein ACQET5_14955 [Halobacteriota archaeon]|uniref:hypothetical protein n=1 Tax=Natronomonas sp. TaxID=2184060 RepID=UPI0039757CFB
MPNTSIRLAVRRLSNTCAPLRTVISRGWNTYEAARFLYASRRNVDERSDSAPISPFDVYDMGLGDPVYIMDDEFDFLTDTGRVLGGHWDRNVSLFEETPRFESFRTHFQEGVAWRETSFFQDSARDIRQNDSDRYATISELEAACDRYDRIYDEIAEHGYRTQRELLGADSARGLGNGGRGLFALDEKAVVRHEIAVNIARDGTHVLNDGRHRLAIALLLDLDSVPARVVVRHAEWQELRNHLYRSAIDSESGTWDRDAAEGIIAEHPTTVKHGLEHPDLKALLPTE